MTKRNKNGKLVYYDSIHMGKRYEHAEHKRRYKKPLKGYSKRGGRFWTRKELEKVKKEKGVEESLGKEFGYTKPLEKWPGRYAATPPGGMRIKNFKTKWHRKDFRGKRSDVEKSLAKEFGYLTPTTRGLP